MEDLEDTLEDEEVDEEGAEPGTPDEDAPTTPAPATTGTGRDEDVESNQDILVKHRSQLKDKAKMLCRDCA